MKPAQRKRIVDRHRDSLTRFGYHPNALYWSGRDIQELRFSILAGIGIVAGDSLLDVGCGFADFNAWFTGHQGSLKYTGLDLSPDLLAQAARLNPDSTLIEGDLFDFDCVDQAFDWVILSGALNEQLHDNGDYARRVIAHMYAICRKGVAFNLLDARHLVAHDLQSHLPADMLDWCRGICPDCRLIDDYLDNDFTIYLYKQPAYKQPE